VDPRVYWASTGWKNVAAVLYAAAAIAHQASSRARLIIFAAVARVSDNWLAARIAAPLADWIVAACKNVSAILRAVVAGYCPASFKPRLIAPVLIAIGAGLGGFVSTNALLHRPAPPAAVPVSTPVQAPPPPLLQASWVTDLEVQGQQRLGRMLLAVSPAELLSIYEHKGFDAVETYKDKWVKIDYPITSLGKQTFGTTTYHVIEAAVHFQSVFPGNIIAYFNEKKWAARLLRHQPHDQIVAYCQFKDIQREAVLTQIHRLWFYGVGCDMPQ
jgi:hypothetical protein